MNIVQIIKELKTITQSVVGTNVNSMKKLTFPAVAKDVPEMKEGLINISILVLQNDKSKPIRVLFITLLEI